jgi:hypothetical protein
VSVKTFITPCHFPQSHNPTGTYGVSPWGIVHNLPGVRSRVRSALYNSLSPNIPFTKEVISNNLSTEEKVAAIAQRQLALELFLREYVVSVENVVSGENVVRKRTFTEEEAENHKLLKTSI